MSDLDLDLVCERPRLVSVWAKCKQKHIYSQYTLAISHDHIAHDSFRVFKLYYSHDLPIVSAYCYQPLPINWFTDQSVNAQSEQ